MRSLEYKLIYAVIVAGKSATFAERAMERLRERMNPQTNEWRVAIRLADSKGRLGLIIRDAKVGNYAKCERALRQFANWNGSLATCSAHDLETIHGIGPKTSRFFLRWSGRRERFAVLDVHILRWLRERGIAAPNATPQSRKEYSRLENLFLAEADRLGIHPADLDEQIWLERNKSGIRV